MSRNDATIHNAKTERERHDERSTNFLKNQFLLCDIILYTFFFPPSSFLDIETGSLHEVESWLTRGYKWPQATRHWGHDVITLLVVVISNQPGLQLSLTHFLVS